MELVYGNSGEAYQVLAKTPNMPQNIENEITKNYCRYDIPENLHQYSSPQYYPEKICYVTTGWSTEYADQKKILLIKSGMMEQFGRPSMYAHAIVRQVTKDYYEQDFFQAFSMCFYNSEDARAMTDSGLLDHHSGIIDGIDEACFEKDKEKLAIIIAMILKKADEHGTLRILSDVGGDGYNVRSRSILGSLYHYLPFDLRRRCGFSSYEKSVFQLDCPTIEIYAPDQRRTSEQKTDIDLSRESLEDLRQFLQNEYLECAKQIVDCTAEERIQLFKKWDSDFGEIPFSASTYCQMQDKIKQWQDMSIKEGIPVWARYAVDEVSDKDSPLQQVLLNLIKDRMDLEVFTQYFIEKLEEGKIEFDHFPTELRYLCYFQDKLTERRIPVEKIAVWFLERYKKNGNNIEWIDLGKLAKATIYSKWYDDLRDELIRLIQDERNRIDAERQKKLEEEQHRQEEERQRQEEERRKLQEQREKEEEKQHELERQRQEEIKRREEEERRKKQQEDAQAMKSWEISVYGNREADNNQVNKKNPVLGLFEPKDFEKMRAFLDYFQKNNLDFEDFYLDENDTTGRKIQVTVFLIAKMDEMSLAERDRIQEEEKSILQNGNREGTRNLTALKFREVKQLENFYTFYQLPRKCNMDLLRKCFPQEDQYFALSIQFLMLHEVFSLQHIVHLYNYLCTEKQFSANSPVIRGLNVSGIMHQVYGAQKINLTKIFLEMFGITNEAEDTKKKIGLPFSKRN